MLLLLAQVEIWKEWGLPGIIIGSLFGLVVYLIKLMRATIGDFRKDVSELTENYRNDIKSITENQDKTTKETVNKFSDLALQQAQDFKDLQQSTLDHLVKGLGNDSRGS